MFQALWHHMPTKNDHMYLFIHFDRTPCANYMQHCFSNWHHSNATTSLHRFRKKWRKCLSKILLSRYYGLEHIHYYLALMHYSLFSISRSQQVCVRFIVRVQTSCDETLIYQLFRLSFVVTSTTVNALDFQLLLAS